jgi:hypothetical protein
VLIQLIVHRFVPLHALYVIVGLLAHGDEEHEYERRYVGEEKADFEEAEVLGECDEQKEEVEEKLEFVPKH